MKNKAILCLAAMALMLVGCSGESTDDSSVGISEAETTSSVEGMTFGNEQDITEPVTAPDGERKYSEFIQQLKENVLTDSSRYCEPYQTDILTHTVKPDYYALLGDKILPESYMPKTESFHGGEISISAQQQAEQHLKDAVQFLFAENGEAYFSVAGETEPSIYRINAFSGKTEHILTADSMDYDFSYFIQVNEGGYVWRCQNTDGEYSTYAQAIGGELYCLDSFLSENPDMGGFVFSFNDIWFEDYTTVEFEGKSDIVPCIFRHYLRDGEYDLVEFNAFNPRLCMGDMIWDSCAPNGNPMPYTDEYAINCRYVISDLRTMYQYYNTENFPSGYFVDISGGTGEPVELFSLWDVLHTPVVAKWLAAAEYRIYNNGGMHEDSYIAVLDYQNGQLTSFEADTSVTLQFGDIMTDGNMIYVPQNDGSLMVIRKEED